MKSQKRKTRLPDLYQRQHEYELQKQSEENLPCVSRTSKLSFPVEAWRIVWSKMKHETDHRMSWSTATTGNKDLDHSDFPCKNLVTNIEICGTIFEIVYDVLNRCCIPSFCDRT